MRIEVTPRDWHEDSGFTDRGETLVGRHVIVSSEGVVLDGEHVIRRDRRHKRNRIAGHDWLDKAGVPWTDFTVSVEP